MSSDFFSIRFNDNKLSFLNQTKLPLIEEYIETDSYERIAEAIEKLEIRGAPAIGIAAAYALAIGMKNLKYQQTNNFDLIYNRLASTRPTAVNLFWALNRIKKVYLENSQNQDIYQILINSAIEIHNDDIIKCDLIAENGLSLIKKRSVVLTHCNTGKLATGGEGTALAVIKKGYSENLISFVYSDETRPLLQGLRLTAFELEMEGIPFTGISESMAAVLIRDKKIDFVITGADRIAANGDSANKIGTYNLAVLCKFHNIPFYIAAPTSTIDNSINSGENIIVEQRKPSEITSIQEKRIAPEHYSSYNPSFDVTPNELIDAIITEKGVFQKPYNF